MFHTLWLFSHQKSMFYTTLDDSHHQVCFTPYFGIHTKRVWFKPKQYSSHPNSEGSYHSLNGFTPETNLFTLKVNHSHSPSWVPTELRTHDRIAIRDVYKLNFGKVGTTNQTKPTQSTAKRVRRDAGARRVVVMCYGRCGPMRGLFAMQCAACGLVAFDRCAVMYGMWCNALWHPMMHGVRYNAMTARCARAG